MLRRDLTQRFCLYARCPLLSPSLMSSTLVLTCGAICCTQVQSLKRLLRRAEDDRAGLTIECQGLTERLGAAASQREAYERECEVSALIRNLAASPHTVYC